MAKYPPKCPDNQFNQRTRIHCYVIYNRPKNIQQQSSWKTETTEVNDIMEKLEKLDGNRYNRKKTSINFHHSMNQTISNALSTGQNPRPQS